jgi:PAS domain S-box-containing protein
MVSPQQTTPGKQLMKRMQQWLVEPTEELPDNIARRQARFVASLLLVQIIFSLVPIFIIIGQGQAQAHPSFLPLVVTLFIEVALYYLSRTRRYMLAATILIVVLTAVFPLVAFLRASNEPNELFGSLIWLLLPLLFSSILLTLRAYILVALAATTTVFLLPVVNSNIPLASIVPVGGVIATIAALLLVITHHRNQLEMEGQAKLEATNQKLRELSTSLEERVTSRTLALATSARVSQQLSTILDQQQLIQEVITQVQQAFHYYHVQIYLFDRQKANLVMVGGTGTAGQTLLAQKHEIAAGKGLVGQAASTNMPVLVPDVGQEPNWLSNPLLPDTRTEVAVPIAVSQKVLGVLDVQHHTANSLDDTDVDLLRSLANQVAIALQNAEQYEVLQKRTQEFQETTRFLDSVLENLPSMLFVKEAETLRFVRWNKAGEELVGFSRREMIGKNDYDFFPKEEADFFTANDREVLARGKLVDIAEEPIQTAHQGTRLLHTRKVPLLDADGKPQYLLGISEDITDQKQIEAQLENRVMQLNLLSEIGRKAEKTHSIPEFLEWICRRIPTVVRHQDACTVAIVLDKEIYGDPQAIDLPRQIVEGLRVGGELIGRLYLAYTDNHTFGDEESALLGNIGQRIASYIETQRLTERTRLLAAIVENHPDFIGVETLEGKTLYVNPAGLRMANYPAGYDVTRLNATDFYPPEDAALLIEEGVPSALKSGSWSSETRLLQADGSLLPVEGTVAANYDVTGQPVSFSITMRDITERRHTAAMLAKQAQELQIVTEVGTAATATNDVAQLLQTVVNLTQEGFKLYHVQIFLFDELNNVLRLAHSAGEVGDLFIQENLTIPLQTKKSLVAQAARSQQGVVAGDVQDTANYLPHPLLPDTRSELIVPLVAGDTLLGVLDVQSNEAGYFTTADFPVYTTLATQVAVALQNVRQYEETQRILTEVQTLQRSMTREGWQAFITARERPIRGYRAHHEAVEAIEGEIESETAVVTPINILGQAIGGLAVRGNVSPENQALLESISQQVGQALERSRLAEQTQTALAETEEQAIRLAQLNEMAAAISAAPTLGDVLQVAAQRTSKIFKGNHLILALLNEQSRTLELYELQEKTGIVDSGDHQVLDGTGLGTAVRENRLVTISNLANSPYSEHKALFDMGLHSTMIAPLSTRTGVVGTLNVSSPKVNAFTQNEENLLLQVASLLATTIESRRLFIEVEDRAAELEVINQVAQTVSQQLEVKQLLTAVHEQVQRAILTDAFFVATYEAERDLVHFPFLYDQGEIYEVDPINADPTIEVAQVIKSGQPILKNFTPEEQKREAEANETLMATGKMPSGMIFVPLRSGRQNIGALSVQNYQFHPYTEADLTLLTGIANHVAVALENVRLFTEAQRRAERERLVNEITRKIQETTTVKNALQTAVYELGQALKAKHAQVALTVSRETNGARNGATEERAYDTEE